MGVEILESTPNIALILNWFLIASINIGINKMYKNIIFGLLSLSFIVSSCADPSPTPFSATPGNLDEYLAPTYTPRPIPTPFPKGENGEIVLLLRKRAAPFEVVILRLPDDCLLSGKECDMDGNLLGALPQGLSQVPNIYWTNDGSKAFFWDDNTYDIYTLDGNQGTFQILKKEVLKVKNTFLVSPSGEEIVFEIQKGDHETDLVSMNVNSGDITKFDIPEPCAKYISQWMDANSFLFWCEKSEGAKGYLVDVEVYVFNTLDHSIHPFDIGRDWMQTSVPLFSPNRKLMIFTDSGTTVVRNVSDGVERIINVSPENFLWSLNSESLVIYGQNKDFSIVRFDGSELETLYSLSENEYLGDWMWLSDNEHILMITTDEDENRRLGILSLLEKTFTPLNLSLLNDYDPTSFSFRP